MEKIILETYIKTKKVFCFAESIKDILKNRIVYNYNDSFKDNFELIDKVMDVEIEEGMYDHITGAVLFKINDVVIVDWQNWDEVIGFWTFFYLAIRKTYLLEPSEYSYAETFGEIQFKPNGDNVVEVYFNKKFKINVDRISLLKVVINEVEHFYEFLWKVRPDLKKDFSYIPKYLEEDKRILSTL